MSETPKKKVYVETSVLGYLTARPSKDEKRRGMQIVTQEWWEAAKESCGLYCSPIVEREAAKGDQSAAELRLAALRRDTIMLEFPPAALPLAEKLLETTALPRNSLDDALHIAVAAISGMDYIATWNCTHIANVNTMPLINATCQIMGWRCPGIYTPYELKGALP